MDIIRNVDINHSFTNCTYLNDKRFSLISAKNNSKVAGSCVTFDSKTSAILASIGEFLERERFMHNKLNINIYKDNLITGYSFISKKSVKLDINYIIGNENKLVDSCGLASHTNSKKCIYNAIKEFIERQSFIFNYLSKGSGKLIDLTGEEKFEYVFKKFENLRFYNISLIEDFYVILGKAIHNGKFYIGLGASNYIDEAISHSIKEIFQTDYSYFYRELNKFKNNNSKRNNYTDYIDIFMSLSTERISEAYKYLDENNTIYKYKELASKEFSIENIFKQLNKQYHMDPLIFFLEPLRSIDALKFVKILDVNWFPNLFPKSYEERIYDFVESVTHKKLDRKCEFIPFP